MAFCTKIMILKNFCTNINDSKGSLNRKINGSKGSQHQDKGSKGFLY